MTSTPCFLEGGPGGPNAITGGKEGGEGRKKNLIGWRKKARTHSDNLCPNWGLGEKPPSTMSRVSGDNLAKERAKTSG